MNIFYFNMLFQILITVTFKYQTFVNIIMRVIHADNELLWHSYYVQYFSRIVIPRLNSIYLEKLLKDSDEATQISLIYDMWKTTLSTYLEWLRNDFNPKMIDQMGHLFQRICIDIHTELIHVPKFDQFEIVHELFVQLITEERTDDRVYAVTHTMKLPETPFYWVKGVPHEISVETEPKDLNVDIYR